MPWRTWNKPSVLGSKRAPQLHANSAAELSQSIWVVYRDPHELQMTVTWSVFLAIVLVLPSMRFCQEDTNRQVKPRMTIW
jgi:hypothetical protein